jgi:hypothetical protein
MLGTVKLPDPEPVCVTEPDDPPEPDECEEDEDEEELFGLAELLAELLALGLAEWVGAAVCVVVGEADESCGEPPAAADDATGELVPPAAHAVSPVPPTTAAMITADTRLILILTLR